MKLVVTEKNIAAKKLAEILATGKPKTGKVSSTAVYTFERDGEEWMSIGLKGHVLGVDFPQQIVFGDGAWDAVWEDDAMKAPVVIPASLATPPWPKKKPFTADGVDLKGWKLAALPYLVWAPIGKTPAERELIRALKSAARKSDEIVIATDFDREGELIGSDAAALVRDVNKKAPIKRARFSALTKGEVVRAFSELVPVDDCLAQAGESRQDIDLVWGAVLTRYLTVAKFTGFGNVKSAGRVQTPTLALIVEREREREAFVPEDYWTVKGAFRSRGSGAAEFAAMHATSRFKTAADATRAMEAVAGQTSGTVAEVKKTSKRVAPPIPFNTTSLQAAAAAEGLTPARTMRVAESLYMDGLISYPRVDNTVYPESLDLFAILDALQGVPELKASAAAIAASAPLHPTRGDKETTDHPPIHPTAAADQKKLKPEAWKLYNLVARRFLATLSDPAKIASTTVTMEVGSEPFVVKGDVLEIPGFRAIYPYGLKKDEQLPALSEQDEVDFLGAELTQKATQPPARYSQGKLIVEMEKRGLGTKATRHAIIERLLEVKYVVDEPPRPTKLGRAVIEALSTYAQRITTPDMTSELETEMDAIAAGGRTRTEVVAHSRELLARAMDDLLPRAAEVGEMLKVAGDGDAKVGVCPKSGHDLLVKSSAKTRGQFVGCSGWPDCDVTYPLPQGKIEAVPEACPACGTPQVKVIQFRSKPRIVCLDPACDTNHEPEVVVGVCSTCAKAGKHGDLIARRSPRTLKRFVRCANYDECQRSYPLPQRGDLAATGETCKACGAPMVIVTTNRGPWKVCIDPACPARPPRTKAKPRPKKR